MKSIKHKNNQLISNIIVVFLVIALPIFVWALVNLNFNYNKKAASGEPVDIAAGEPFLGLYDAPVTIVEYGDLVCPYCKMFADNTLHQILQDYPTQVRFVYKDYPLASIHPFALKAAIAGQCAYKQGKFWQMHDLILENQESLSDNLFADFASQIFLNTDSFNSCYSNQETLSEVEDDLTEGSLKGVSGTPTFYINDQVIAGAYPYETFKSIIDSELGIETNPSPTPTTIPDLSTLPPSTPSPTPVVKTGDVNNDNKVNMIDIGIVVDEYDSTNPIHERADVNGNGKVDLIDIGIIIDNYEW